MLAEAQAVSSNHTLMDAVVGTLLVVTQLGTVLVSHLKGKRGQKAQSDGMDKRLGLLSADLRQAISTTGDSIRQDMGTLSSELRDLKAHVIGPDGKNGLRGEVREIKAELALLAPRQLVTAIPQRKGR